MTVEIMIDNTVNMIDAQMIYDFIEKQGHQAVIVNKETNEEEIGRSYCHFCGHLLTFVKDEFIENGIRRYLKCDCCNANIITVKDNE